MASIYSTVIVICCACQKDWNYNGRIHLRIFYVACGAIMIGLSALLGTLLGWHIYLITRNMTTIEHYEGIRAAWFAKKSGLTYRHPFDISIYKNITS
ncbi:Zinc finger, DHHC-type, palmitoyltransferase, partial [Corchorus capsularis]